MKRRYYLLIVTIALVLMFLVACGGATSPATSPAQTGTTAPVSVSPSPTGTSSVTSKPPTTAPPTTTGISPQYGGKLIYVRNTGLSVLGAPPDMPTFSWYNPIIMPALEPLILADAKGNPQPWLAESIDVSSDGTSITFKLRKGIKFHDGTDFNASAVKFNLDACVAANVSGSDVLKSVSSYDIIDDYTLRLNLKKYDARILPALANSTLGQMGSPSALLKVSSGDTLARDHLVGTGPFKFDSWQRDQYVRYVKWDGYWQKGKPYVDSIEMRNNADVTVSIMSLKAGEANWVENIDPSDYVALQKEGYAVEISSDLFFIFSIFMDSANSDSPFSNLKVRQAVEYAIDREGMAKGIGMGTMNAVYQHAVEKDPWFIPDQPKIKYDPAKAKQLLGEAGYPNGFTCKVTSDVRVRKDQLVAIQTYLKDVGINTVLDMADVPRYTELTRSGWQGILIPGFPNADTFTSWVGLYNNPIFTYPSMIKPAGWNDGWNAVISEPNIDKRYAMMRELQKKLYDQSLIITYIGDSPRGVTDGTVMDKNFYKNGLMGYWEPWNVWLKKK